MSGFVLVSFAKEITAGDEGHVEPQRTRFKSLSTCAIKRDYRFFTFAFLFLIPLTYSPNQTYTQHTHDNCNLTTRTEPAIAPPYNHKQIHTYTHDDFYCRRLVQSLSQPPQPNPSLKPLYRRSHPERTGTLISLPCSIHSPPTLVYLRSCAYRLLSLYT